MSRFSRFSITAAVLASLTLFLSPTSRGEEPKREKVFVGYLFGPPKDLNYALYTHICHAFVTAGGDGRLNPNRSVPSRAVTTEAHAAGVKVLVSLGGWGWDDQFREIVADPKAEARYVEAVVKLVDEFDYDGIDLDWEYPDADNEVPGFERLTRTFRKRLDAIGKAKGREMLVTMAASSNFGTLSRLDPAFLVETMDWINVMTYDFAGAWSPRAGHNAPLFASSQDGPNGGSTARAMLDFLEKRGVPADRLAVGLPLYGRGFHVPKPYTSIQGSSEKPFDVNYKDAVKRLAEGWKRTWDDETKVPWLTSPDGKKVIGFDDAESIRLKTDWAMSRGFRGVFFWQVDGDRLPDGSNPLQQAAHQAWEAGRAAPK
ncbi:glycoside hydrolase family 18 protein [Planctomyces sp. SH-PL62]|uniref:glycoside hydrolase family 18 protein n=1 Tax=Planctomyces sp. SH-PL62 TaxID=1636152 RepID=UPI00078CFA73|nr:glycosyl hydrolase family 18 protein [Planctomyces sp. SH-PL62]AMV39548.1 Chitinase A1 precursor [Planctomyces sp. SH-PL62]